MRVDVADWLDVQGMKPVLEECWFLAGEVEHYNRSQMREVYFGVMGYQTERCIKLYSSHELTPNQMREIRLGFEDGLSYREVLAYCDRKLPWQVMRHMRLTLRRAKDGGMSFKTSDDAFRYLLFGQAGFTTSLKATERAR